uniref:Lysosomal trafficking regulator lyst n=1 Tax=Mesocestoides corti TaxID=53468 RepID=A0A5K3ETP9_MESCO
RIPCTSLTERKCCESRCFTLANPVTPASDTGSPFLQHVVSRADPQFSLILTNIYSELSSHLGLDVTSSMTYTSKL